MKEQFGNITLIQGDCMDFLCKCSGKAFNLAIVDPPYGINAAGMNATKSARNRLQLGSGKLKNRVLQTMRAEWDACPPDQKYFDELFRVSEQQIIWGGNYFHLPPTRGIICWDKCQPWENFSQIEAAWTSYDIPARLFRFDNRTADKIHPTQKPVALYKWLLDKYAKPGDRILDTHGGSMSHAIACHDLGFELTIIEKDPSYYTAAKQRLIDHQAQQKLF